MRPVILSSSAELQSYEVCRACVEELALYLKPLSAAKGACASVHVKVPNRQLKKCPFFFFF